MDREDSVQEQPDPKPEACQGDVTPDAPFPETSDAVPGGVEGLAPLSNEAPPEEIKELPETPAVSPGEPDVTEEADTRDDGGPENGLETPETSGGPPPPSEVETVLTEPPDAASVPAPEAPGKPGLVRPEDVETVPAEELPDAEAETQSAGTSPEELAAAREALVAGVFGAHVPTKSEHDRRFEAYGALLSSLSEGLSDEFKGLLGAIEAADRALLASEKTEFETYEAQVCEDSALQDLLYQEIAVLAGQVADVLAPLDPESAGFQEAAEELQARMMNTRKGVEIIHRMLSRVVDRKKTREAHGIRLETISQDMPCPALAEDVPLALAELYKAWRIVRDGNYNAQRDLRQYAEKTHKECISLVRSILGAIDGIDSGLEYAESTADGAEDAGLPEGWGDVYPRLAKLCDAFFEKTGIAAHTVERGTPFDPDTMEPQGTVAAPDLNDEEVAAVMRRGFSLRGESVRPILVDVVRNQ